METPDNYILPHKLVDNPQNLEEGKTKEDYEGTALDSTGIGEITYEAYPFFKDFESVHWHCKNTGVKPIKGLPNLKSVSIRCKHYIRIVSVWAFDLPQLEELIINLEPTRKMVNLAIHNCPNLKKIRINGYKPETKAAIKKYKSLSVDAEIYYKFFTNTDLSPVNGNFHIKY